jgi:hypothetical protein
MAKENEEQIQEEAYSGADFDTIEVPDEARTILADQDEAAEQEEDKPGQEEKPVEQQETREERQQRKRNDYQKRLNELVRQKHEAEERAAAAEARAELLEQRRLEAEKGAHESTTSLLKQREQELIERRRIAEEVGDMKSYSEVSDELFKVRGRMSDKPAEADKPAPKKVAPPPIAPEATAWLETNAWFNDPKNDHLAAEVERIEGELIRRGYNLNNPDQAKRLYAEIDRRIRQFPEFDSVLGVAEEEQEEQEHKEPEKKPVPRSHIAPPSRGGEAPQRQKAGELTQHDIRAIKTFGLNPEDPKVRAAYLKRKRA